MANSANLIFSTLLSFMFIPSLMWAEMDQKIDTTTQTSVIFNTLCAKCHEGECSGRLSFDTGSEAARHHISHYSGEANLTERKTREFFRLLNYMKKRCAIYMPEGGKWELKHLSHFALPSHKGYFIPLGTLKKGRYRLLIQTKEEIPFRLEILSDKIDSIYNQSIRSAKKGQMLHFSIERPTTTFVRIRSREPLHLITLEII